MSYCDCTSVLLPKPHIRRKVQQKRVWKCRRKWKPCLCKNTLIHFSYFTCYCKLMKYAGRVLLYSPVWLSYTPFASLWEVVFVECSDSEPSDPSALKTDLCQPCHFHVCHWGEEVTLSLLTVWCVNALFSSLLIDMNRLFSLTYLTLYWHITLTFMCIT